jgi:hypothetical protein
MSSLYIEQKPPVEWGRAGRATLGIYCAEMFHMFNGYTLKDPRNRFQGIYFASLGRYDNPIPTRFKAPTDCYEILAQVVISRQSCCGTGDGGSVTLVEGADT